MAKKLNSLIANKPLKSAVEKTFIFGLALFLLHFFDFSLPVLTAFFALTILIYFYLSSERTHLRISYIVLVILSPIFLKFIYPFSFWLLSILIFCFLFYWWVGLANIIFKNRQTIFLLLNTCLFLGLFSLLFYFRQPAGNNFFWQSLVIFLSAYFLFRECFNFFRLTASYHLLIVGNDNFSSLLLAFFNWELFWAISLAPIGFLNAALLQTAMVVFLRDFSLAHYFGKFNRRLFLQYGGVLLFLILLIFISSKWFI